MFKLLSPLKPARNLALLIGILLTSVAAPIYAEATSKIEWNQGRSQQVVPDFELKDLEGKTYRLSQFRGNLVFLNFWATWCPPCLQELPAMQALNELLKGESFTMIAVSVDEDLKQVKEFLSKLPVRLSFLILHDPEHKVSSALYGTTVFPETYWIDSEGRLLKKFEGAENWVSSHLSELQQRLIRPAAKKGK